MEESSTTRRAAIGSILLVFVGLVTGLATVGAGVSGSDVDRLVTGFLIVISGGYVATGTSWIAQERAGSRYAQLPAIALVVLGVSHIIGGLVSFHPLKSTVNQGLQMMLMGVLVLTGIGLVLVGRRWARERQMRYPLGILAGGLVLGLAYFTHQRFDVFDTWPVMLLIGSVAVLIAVVIASGGPPESQLV